MFVYRSFHHSHACLKFAIGIKSDWKHSVPCATFHSNNDACITGIKPGNQTTGRRYIYTKYSIHTMEY